MVINESALLRAMREDYKGQGYTVARRAEIEADPESESILLLSANDWMVEIGWKNVSAKIFGLVLNRFPILCRKVSRCWLPPAAGAFCTHALHNTAVRAVCGEYFYAYRYRIYRDVPPIAAGNIRLFVCSGHDCFVDIHRVHLLTPFLVLQISPPRYSLKLPPVLAACPP